MPLILLLLPLALAAEGNAAIDSIARQFRVEEVEVVARRRETAVIPVQTLRGPRLTGLSSQSVADAVRYFSGVQLKDYGGVGGLKTVDLRSMGTHHLGVFYDGIEIGNAQNGTVDLGKFSMEMIEEICLYNGQKSEIFQSAKDFGSAGTLYIRTRRPRFAPDKDYNVHIGMKAGSFGLANPSVLYEQRLTDNLHLSVSGEYTYATGRYHYRYRRVLPSGAVAWDTTAVRQNGDVNAYRVEAGLFGYMPEGKWHLKAYLYGSEKGIPGAIVNNVWRNGQRQWDRNAFVQGNVTQTWGDYSMQVNMKYTNDHLRYLNPDTTLMYIDNTFDQQEIYLSTAHKYSLSSLICRQTGCSPQMFDWDVNLSADYQLNWLHSDMVQFVHPLRHTVLVAAATAVHYRWLRLQTSVLGTFIVDRLTRPTAAQSSAAPRRMAWTPAVFFSYQPYLPEQFFIRAFYKQVFRMPTFNDLYYTDVGSISLRPERAEQFDLGLEYDKQILHPSHCHMVELGLKTDGYFNRVHDKIVAIPKGNGQYRWQMMNLGYVEILGVDCAADLTIMPIRDLTLTVAGTYTWQQARDLSDPNSEFYGGQIAYIPHHSGSVTGHIGWRELSINYSFIYVGSRYHNSANIPANYEQPWYTHDLSMGYTFDTSAIARGKLHPRLYIGVEINNLFNQQYEVIQNYPMPGINGKGIVRLML